MPQGVTVDGGNVYVSDTGNNRVRKVSYVDYADQPTFTLTNVTPASLSNNYSVIITSASGSVTSSVASLNLQLPPITPAFTRDKRHLQFHLERGLQPDVSIAIRHQPRRAQLDRPRQSNHRHQWFCFHHRCRWFSRERYYRVRLLP